MIAAASAAKLAAFIAFVVLGLSVRDSRGAAAMRFVCFFVAVTTLAGLTQREAWPFTNWALFHHLAPQEFSGVTVEVSDAHGNTYATDSRMWQPIGEEEAESWLALRFASLNELQKRELAADLLARAERTRDAIASGRRAPNERILGALAAPYHFQRREVWGAATPPFRAIRIVSMRWSPEERHLNPVAVRREVLYEYAR